MLSYKRIYRRNILLSMLLYYYTYNCPICGPEGELIIAKQTTDGRLVMVCAECYIGFYRESDVDDANKSVDMLGVKLSIPTKGEIVRHGWGHLMQHVTDDTLHNC